MRKISYLLLFSIAFLCFSAIVSSLSGLIPFSNAWIPLIIAFAILIAATVLSVIFRNALKKKLFFIVSLNSIALGFAIRAWYIYRNIENSIWVLFLVALVASAVLLLFYVISFIPFVEKHYSVFFWVLSVLMLVLFIVSVILTRNTFLSTFGYYLIFVWALIVCMCNDAKDEDFYQHVLFASFSVWIVAVIILILMLNGDSFDFDLFDWAPDSPKNQRVT